jgi:ABC-2 type transport system ATP-binding protein
VVAEHDPVVRVRGLRKSYRRQHALAGVDLEVESGQIYGLLGPDGAGKSTLMKAVAGVLEHDLGDLEVFGVTIDSERSAERIKPRLGFMPQGLGQNLYRELSVEENVDFFARLRGVSAVDLERRKAALYEMTRLGEFRHRRMMHLSGGMKQKLGLICTLVHEPDLVILDEPTTGVDPVSRRDFWSILSDLLRERGVTVLVSTAYMDEASRFHRAAMLYEGRVLAEGEPNDIRGRAPGAVVSVRTRHDREAHRALESFDRVTVLGDEVRAFAADVSLEEARQAAEEALQGTEVDADAVEAAEPSLEDVFLTLLERESEAEEEHDRDPELAYPEADKGSGSRTAVRADGLVKRFDGFTAVDGVDFEVARGEIFGLLGANGAGKTTVIKMLLGILGPSEGSGEVAGAEMRRAARVLRERVGYMSQQFSLYEDLKVGENIRLYAGIYGLGRAETRRRVGWILEMSGLERHRGARTGSLPVGLKQRLALGCALVHRPAVLFLDEPTSGVDPLGRHRFWAILHRLSREAGVAILVTTHYMSEAEHCDRLALMYAGRIVAGGSPEEMKKAVEEEAGTLLEVRSQRPLEALELLEKEGFEGVALFGRDIHLLAGDVEGAAERIREVLRDGGLEVESITRRPLSMEDVFVYHTLGLERREREAA